VLAECRAHALTTETHGIWGGMSETERARHTRRTRLPSRPASVWRRRALYPDGSEHARA
jgi:hypothetical protein